MFPLSFSLSSFYFFFFFNDTATTEIYTLSLHDALPISVTRGWFDATKMAELHGAASLFISRAYLSQPSVTRSEEHTSELQSLAYLVCRLLLEKKKKKKYKIINNIQTN